MEYDPSEMEIRDVHALLLFLGERVNTESANVGAQRRMKYLLLSRVPVSVPSFSLDQEK